MKLITTIVALLSLTLIACGQPTAPDSPDASTYGQTIQPDHNVPDEHQEGN